MNKALTKISYTSETISGFGCKMLGIRKCHIIKNPKRVTMSNFEANNMIDKSELLTVYDFFFSLLLQNNAVSDS